MGSGRGKFPHLFSKDLFGEFETKNRVQYAAHRVSNDNSADGFITER
jgi:hypothetical protein